MTSPAINTNLLWNLKVREREDINNGFHEKKTLGKIEMQPQTTPISEDLSFSSTMANR